MALPALETPKGWIAALVAIIAFVVFLAIPRDYKLVPIQDVVILDATSGIAILTDGRVVLWRGKNGSPNAGETLAQWQARVSGVVETKVLPRAHRGTFAATGAK